MGGLWEPGPASTGLWGPRTASAGLWGLQMASAGLLSHDVNSDLTVGLLAAVAIGSLGCQPLEVI